MMRDKRVNEWLVDHQRGLLSRGQVLACGLTVSNLRYRIRPGGPWRRVMPAVYATFTGDLDAEQRHIAALLYAGPGSLITGAAALRCYGLPAPKTNAVDLLVPADRQRSSVGHVVLHRTRRLPTSFAVDGARRLALPARAVCDALLALDRPRGSRPADAGLADARTVVASAVQRRRCSVEQLMKELAAGPRRGSAVLRMVLAEVADGTESAPEAELRGLIRACDLPVPLFNAVLYLNGRFLARTDAFWREAGVVAEVDSRQWHLKPEDWEQTMRRQRVLAAAGLVVLHITPRQLRAEPRQVLADIAAALRNGRPVPGIEVRRR